MKIMLSHSIFFQSLPNEPHAWTRTTQYTTQWRPELFWIRNPINFTQKWNLKSAIVWKNIDLIWHRLWKNVTMSCLTSPRPELSAKWILSILSDFTSHQLKSKHLVWSQSLWWEVRSERIERIHFAESSSPRVNFYQCQIKLIFVGFYQQKITNPPCQIG